MITTQEKLLMMTRERIVALGGRLRSRQVEGLLEAVADLLDELKVTPEFGFRTWQDDEVLNDDD